MPAPTPQYVRDLSLKTPSEFVVFTDGQIDNVIVEVLEHYLSMTTESLYERVVGLHTAHILKVALMSMGGGGQGGIQGPLISAKVGPLEKKYGQVEQAPIVIGDGLDESTEYGRRCIALLKTRLPSVRTTYY